MFKRSGWTAHLADCGQHLYWPKETWHICIDKFIRIRRLARSIDTRKHPASLAETNCFANQIIKTTIPVYDNNNYKHQIDDSKQKRKTRLSFNFETTFKQTIYSKQTVQPKLRSKSGYKKWKQLKRKDA